MKQKTNFDLYLEKQFIFTLIGFPTKISRVGTFLFLIAEKPTRTKLKIMLDVCYNCYSILHYRLGGMAWKIEKSLTS